MSLGSQTCRQGFEIMNENITKPPCGGIVRRAVGAGAFMERNET